jgi:hypothetical protein
VEAEDAGGGGSHHHLARLVRRCPPALHDGQAVLVEETTVEAGEDRDVATATPELGAKTDTLKSDGLVLARNVGYEDWVRRPASIDAMAMPPIRPMSRTTLR